MSVNNINGMNSPLFRQNVTANNVANVNTPGFQPATVQTSSSGSSAAYINSVGQGGGAAPSAGTYAPPRASASVMAMPAASASAPATASTPAPAAATTVAPRMSNVDMITETANRMGAQSAYNANMPAAQSMNGMMQTLMDMVG